jgi:hypothetical protein
MSDAIGIRGSSFIVSPAGEPPDRINTLFQQLWGRQFRKVGRFVKLTLSGAALAVRDSGIDKLPRDRTGVFLGTGLGNISDLLSFSQSALGFGNPVPSPIEFANAVGSAGAFYAAQGFDLCGPAIAISQGEVSFEAALLNAATLIRSGDIDVALVGGVDAYCPTEPEHLRRMGYDPETVSGIRLGDGAGWVILDRLSDADVALLEDVSIDISDDVEGDLRRHFSRTSGDAVASLALGSRLARRATDWVAGWSPRPRLFASDSPPATFLTESAAWTCQFLAAPGTRDEVFHCASLTGEERLGLVTVRRTRERKVGGPANHEGATK